MAKKPRYLTGAVYRTTAALDAATLPQLDQIAPDNISEAIRFCVAYALERGALAAALAQHTPQQRAAWLERYHQPQPITQLYNGQPIPAAAPAPQPMESQAAEPAPRIATLPPATFTDAPYIGAMIDEQSPMVSKPAQISPADMLAYAKRFCTDDDLDAARLELEQMEAAARKQRNPL
jgi:hypothetical protein